MLKLFCKYSFLFDVGGALYVLIELIWRGWSHWTMFILGGLCFVMLGLINEVLIGIRRYGSRCGSVRLALRLWNF